MLADYQGGWIQTREGWGKDLAEANALIERVRERLTAEGWLTTPELAGE
jgi:hypothetical protein